MILQCFTMKIITLFYMFYLYDIGLITLITRRSTFMLLIMSSDMVSKNMKWSQAW